MMSNASVRITCVIFARLALLTFFAVSLAATVISPAARTDIIDLVFQGRVRRAVIHIPASYGGEPMALMFSFHALGGTSAQQIALTNFNAIADRAGFLVVYPDGFGGSWNALYGIGEAERRGIDDVGYVSALLDELSRKYKVDQRRIYASGFSNGGVFSMRLGCELSQRFAAVAVVASTMGVLGASRCTPVQPVPILLFHGTSDRIVPYAGGTTSLGGSVLSAPMTAAEWLRHNRCSGLPTENFRKGKVVCMTTQSCSAPVTLCTVNQGGHTWPGNPRQAWLTFLLGPTNMDVDASEMIWQFLSQCEVP